MLTGTGKAVGTGTGLDIETAAGIGMKIHNPLGGKAAGDVGCLQRDLRHIRHHLASMAMAKLRRRQHQKGMGD